MTTNRLPTTSRFLQARENIGSLENRDELQSALNNLVRASMFRTRKTPPARCAFARPLRKQTRFPDVEGEPGWYSVNMAVAAHLSTKWVPISPFL